MRITAIDFIEVPEGRDLEAQALFLHNFHGTVSSRGSVPSCWSGSAILSTKRYAKLGNGDSRGTSSNRNAPLNYLCSILSHERPRVFDF